MQLIWFGFLLVEAQPSVDAAMISPKAVASEPRKSTIGARKPAAKKGVGIQMASMSCCQLNLWVPQMLLIILLNSWIDKSPSHKSNYFSIFIDPMSIPCFTRF